MELANDLDRLSALRSDVRNLVMSAYGYERTF